MAASDKPTVTVDSLRDKLSQMLEEMSPMVGEYPAGYETAIHELIEWLVDADS